MLNHLSDPKEVFDDACAWLAQMTLVGVTDRYTELVTLTCDFLSVPIPAEPPHANINPQRTDPAMRYRDQLAPDVVTRLEELNRYDLEIYAHAQELFEQQWARYQARPRRTYSIAAHARHRLRLAKTLAKKVYARTEEIIRG
jgi:hypothetical protein